MVDVDGVATEEPYQCAGLTEFCQYEDCVAGQKLKDPERPRATPLDRKDRATQRLFVDPDRRAALKGGKKTVHAAWGLAPENRPECQRCNRAGRSEGGLQRMLEIVNKRPASHACNDPFGANCAVKAYGSDRPCLVCREKLKRQKEAAAAGANTDALPPPSS